MDESGFSIGTIEASKVIINKWIRECYQVHPGRQEWVTSVECICADSMYVPPLIIFRAENISSAWIPENVPHDWQFSCNSKGWTSNQHGIQWLCRCFDPSTRHKANGQYRLLINDGYDSHITGDWLDHCLQNHIVPVILTPHSSRLTQPLDVGIFGPLKKAMTRKIMPLMMTQVHRIQKIEWLSAFIKAHENVFNSRNIESAFSGAGLVPFQPAKVIRRVAPPPSLTSSPPPAPAAMPSPFDKEVLTSSPVDMDATRKANATLNQLLASKALITTPVRNYIACVTRQNERLYARKFHSYTTN